MTTCPTNEEMGESRMVEIDQVDMDNLLEHYPFDHSIVDQNIERWVFNEKGLTLYSISDPNGKRSYWKLKWKK